MAISTAFCTSAKSELFSAVHNFTASTGHTFKVALFTSSATLGASTTAYSTTNEITNTAGSAYTAGGATLSQVSPTTSGTTAFVDFADTSWSSASFTTNGAQIYNASASNKSISTHAFGSDQTVSNGTFTLVWPSPDATNAILRIA